MNDSHKLLPHHHEAFVKALKSHYIILRIFSAWFLFLSVLGLFGFLFSFATDEGYSSGMFEIPVMRALVFFVSFGFISLLVIGTSWLFFLPIRMIRRAERYNYEWKSGTVTRIPYNIANRRLWIDNIQAICLGFSIEDMSCIQLGDRLLTIKLKNNYFVLNTRKEDM